MSTEERRWDSYQLSELAISAIQAEHYQQAERLLLRSLSLEIANGSTANQAADWGNLGLVMGLTGRIDACIRCLWRAYQLHLRVHDYHGCGTDLMNLAEVFECTQRRQLVRLCLAGAARHFDQTGLRKLAEDARRRLALDLSLDQASAHNPLLN